MRGLTAREASLPKSGNTPQEGVTAQQDSLNHEDHVIARRLKVREATVLQNRGKKSGSGVRQDGQRRAPAMQL